MIPTRQIFITFRVILAREMVRVFFIIRNHVCLVRCDPFAVEWGRGRRLHRSRLLLRILVRIASGYPFCFAGSGERPGARTTECWKQSSSSPPS